MTVRLYEPTRAPKVWCLWLASFGATPATAQQLWRVLLDHRTAQELGAVVRAQRRRDRRAVGELLAVITPGRLLQLTAILSPEGQVRAPQIITVEQRIVQAALNPHTWR